MTQQQEAFANAQEYFGHAEQNVDDADRFRDYWSALNALYDSGRWTGSELAKARSCVAALTDDEATRTEVLALPEVLWLGKREAVWEPSWGEMPASLRGVCGVLKRHPGGDPEKTSVATIDTQALDDTLSGGGDITSVRDDLVEVIYAVRNNLFHGNKAIYRHDNIEVIGKAVVPLRRIVELAMAGVAGSR